MQAIGRIDRIGQNRDITIHHFVMRDTIEEQIYHKSVEKSCCDWTPGSLTKLLTRKK